MKLLLDENLSPRLLREVTVRFPGSEHVVGVGLSGHSDRDIARYAARNGFVLVTKDDDFRELARSSASPPKVVWLRVGNAGTTEIAALLLTRRDELEDFARATDRTWFELAI